MSRLHFLMTASALALLLATPGAADDTRPKARPAGLPEFYDQLGLSAEQTARAARVHAEYRAEVRRLLEQIRSAREKEEARLQALLTDAQKTRLKELRAAGVGTFTLTCSSRPVEVRRGQSASVVVSVKRSPDFKVDVTLTFAGLPKGLKVEPSSVVVHPGGDGDARLKVVAGRNAPLGEHTLQIFGTPTRGSGVDLFLKIRCIEP
jgi:hypothetical protein